MSIGRKVIVYGANGYTGKLVAESLAQRQIPFYFAGRSRDKLEKALGIVRERLGASAWKLDAEIVAVDNSVETLLPVFRKCSIVINVAGPFMQVAWPVVEAALKAGCHYTDTTGEQDWTRAIADKFGAEFAAKGLLMAPATSFMWSAGRTGGRSRAGGSGDRLARHPLPGGQRAALRGVHASFLRMVCNDTSQYYLEQNEYKAWPNDVAYDCSSRIAVPGCARIRGAAPASRCG